MKKFFCVLLVLSLLSVPVFAVDDLIVVDGVDGSDFSTFGNTSISDYGISVLSGDQYAVTVSGYFYRYSDGARASFAMSDSNPSASASASEVCRGVRFTNITASFSAGTLTIDFSEFSSVPSFSTSTAGASVSVSGSSLIITSDGSAQPILLTSSSSYTPAVSPSNAFSLSSSFVPDDPVDPGPEPENPFAGTGSMFGWTGKTIFGLQTKQEQHWYTNGTGSERVGHLDATYEYGDAVSVPGYWVMQNMVASLTVQKWQWKIKPETGLPAFNVDENYKGTWSDMIYRTSVYNYFWGNKLWNNDVSDSWYGSISSSFSYLNFRVNQILDVLANDEDLAIKDATTPERDWVKGYFAGSGDKADADKYDKLNNTGSAFKDAFAGAPDSSIADGFTAVNDNGYDFWSQGVSDDINGNSASSSGVTRAPAYVPPEQRIVDAYSENWTQIVGGYYD